MYNRLVDVSNQLHDEHSVDAIGFDKALFTLHYALKQYDSVNLHFENKSLNRQLDYALSKLKESNITRDVALQENNKLIAENHKLKSESGTLRLLYQKASANKILK